MVAGQSRVEGADYRLRKENAIKHALTTAAAYRAWKVAQNNTNSASRLLLVEETECNIYPRGRQIQRRQATLGTRQNFCNREILVDYLERKKRHD